MLGHVRALMSYGCPDQLSVYPVGNQSCVKEMPEGVERQALFIVKFLLSDESVLIDVDVETFNLHNLLVYYVGASRARLQLDIVSELTKEDRSGILREVFNRTSKIRNPMLELAGAMNAAGDIAD